ncbi:hypothetical protein DICPUDRAFT_42075 [Dictyostelium purpureum]|uniref:diacylglycerol O-acyltransferase n=1 Tax=Dictyostelium purpureum TaxID=5786 RepID=F1A1C5_DICPU|nr:uncharacterized protein DICPUDRAFT_42075 [Dictyostelium purpureum]EGC30005.1 hypothetical protein DICPUDRAFT_42075 [Dictyostelium purpureum]|eukprot:XP_003293471.1 hypothetical protein DICPUDRAFT_42075 [Dictyostelium purpureum]
MIETENSSSKTIFQKRKTESSGSSKKKRTSNKHDNNETTETIEQFSTTSTLKVDKLPPHSPSLERFSAMSKPRESILTTPNESDIGWGTFNYIAICYVMAGFSMMADSYINKGTLVDFELFWWLVINYQVLIYVTLGLATWSFFNYFCTRQFAKHRIPSGVSIFLYVFWQFVCFAGSISFVLAHEMSPILSGGTGLQICVYSLKNHSYWHTNYFLTKGLDKAKSKVVRVDLTPNISFRHFLYFMVAPTLVFETSFPRTKSIRWTYVLKELIAGAGAFLMFYIVCLYSNKF